MGLFRKQPPAEVIDLREPAPEQKFGFPTPCPECGGHGYLDSIDLTERVMYQHCTTCFTRWETSEAELVDAH